MKKQLLPIQPEVLLATLKIRFQSRMRRYEGIEWVGVQAKLEKSAEKLWILDEMEITGGEPDVTATATSLFIITVQNLIMLQGGFVAR